MDMLKMQWLDSSKKLSNNSLSFLFIWGVHICLPKTRTVQTLKDARLTVNNYLALGEATFQVFRF
jgi:hypothetical protein